MGKVKTSAASETDKALFSAVKKGDLAGAKKALADGANVNVRQTVGEYPKITAMHLAVVGDRSAIIRLLVEHHADLNAPDADGTPPLHYACGAMMSNSSKVSLETVTFLLDKGANVDGTSNGCITALHPAVGSRRKDVVELLLARGADINHVSTFHTVLYEACKADGDDFFRFLLAKGGDLSITDSYDTATDTPVPGDGFTPLHQAALYDNLAVAEYLLQHGADPKALYQKKGVAALARSDEMKALLGKKRKK